MKLISFQIKNYKVIADTKPVTADPRVIALVGKNESGKSSVLKSLWKSRNVAGAKFDKLYDYPRDTYSRDRKGTQEVTILRFELSPTEIDEVVSQLPHSQSPKVATYITRYAGEDQISSKVTFDDDVEAITLGSKACLAIDTVANTLSATGADAVASVTAAAFSEKAKIDTEQPIWKNETTAALDSFATTVDGWIAADAARASVAVSEREALATLIAQAKQGDPWAKARSWAQTNLPTFIYFDNYGQLETRIHLRTYLTKKDSLDPKIRTQTALFEWSHIDPHEILELGRPRTEGEADDQVHRRLEKRRALLDSASFDLTGAWVQWWSEKRHKLHFDADGDDLVLKVSDEHNEFPLPFEERSHGFQWFFSFYLVFLVESKKAHKDAILLLDEPGLHLHPTLQLKLIELFERISETNQLIYSTHLPFLVDGNHFDRVRTVYLTGPEPQKAVVSNDVRPTGDRDTLFPLQAALGYSIAQTLFLGKRSVIVEGITDFWIIKALDGCLSTSSCGVSLHEDTILIPAGGTSRLMPLASIMHASTGVGERRLIVLLDSDKEGHDAARRFAREFGDASTILMLGAAIGVSEATVEDLVPREAYVEVLKELGHNLTLNDEEKAAPTNVKAMEMVFQRENLGKFGTQEKTAAARALIAAWGKDPAAILAATKEKARALFQAINASFDRNLT